MIQQLGDTTIRRNFETDVWKFIISDLSWAMNNLAPNPLQPGRITMDLLAECWRGLIWSVRSGMSGGQRAQADLTVPRYRQRCL
jgi:hypothetical protein